MRMMAKGTSKMDFFDKNKEMATGLAMKEIADAKEKAKETQVSAFDFIEIPEFRYCTRITHIM